MKLMINNKPIICTHLTKYLINDDCTTYFMILQFIKYKRRVNIGNGNRTKLITKKILLMRRSTLYKEYGKIFSSVYNNRHYAKDMSFIVVFYKNIWYYE